MSFLLLPAEVREKIYKLLLHKNTGEFSCTDVINTIVIKYAPFYNERDLSTRLLPVSINAGCISLLRVCQLIHDEASKILYESQRFSSMQAHAFATSFASTIGTTNLAFIKRLHLQTGTECKITNSARCYRLASFLAYQMPGLKVLELCTRFHEYQVPRGTIHGQTRAAEEQATLLWISAYVVSHHSSLTRALWSQSQRPDGDVEDHSEPEWTNILVTLRTETHPNDIVAICPTWPLRVSLAWLPLFFFVIFC